jgi:hypothetical protein
MAEKSSHKGTQKVAARSLKEKRADKKDKAARTNHSEDIVAQVKKR